MDNMRIISVPLITETNKENNWSFESVSFRPGGSTGVNEYEQNMM